MHLKYHIDECRESKDWFDVKGQAKACQPDDILP